MRGDLGHRDGASPAQVEDVVVVRAEIRPGPDSGGHHEAEQVEMRCGAGAAIADGVGPDQPSGLIVEPRPFRRVRHPQCPAVCGAPGAWCLAGVARYGRTLLTSMAIS